MTNLCNQVVINKCLHSHQVSGSDAGPGNKVEGGGTGHDTRHTHKHTHDTDDKTAEKPVCVECPF